MSRSSPSSSVVQMSSTAWQATRVDPWTAEHRARVAELVAEEVSRRGLNSQTGTGGTGTSWKTMERILKGENTVAPTTVLQVTDALGIPRHIAQPPRPEYEQAQLDRIEELLGQILKRLMETPAQIGKRAVGRTKTPTPEATEAQPSTEATPPGT